MDTCEYWQESQRRGEASEMNKTRKKIVAIEKRPMATKIVKELYAQTLYLVCDYTELSEDDVLTSNREECVDARYIIVSVLGEWLTDDEIAKLTGLTRSGCNKMRNGMQVKLTRFSFRALYESVKDNIREWLDSTQ